MNKTKIEYLDRSWNPLAMCCTPVSAGCAHCWHLAMANRLASNPKIPKNLREAYSGNVGPVLVESRLDEPLRLRKPAVIGVQFMGDLFHEDVSLWSILQVYNVAEDAPQHTYLWLTKRPGRALEFHKRYIGGKWLPNIWLGVTIESPEYSYRSKYLRNTPAAVRFISFEPLLGSFADYPGVLDDIDLAIVGGESGPGARPMDPQWPRGLRDQCQAAGVPFFFKGWGAWVCPLAGMYEDMPFPKYENSSAWDGETGTIRIGKAAGRLLDGREWNEMPEIVK